MSIFQGEQVVLKTDGTVRNSVVTVDGEALHGVQAVRREGLNLYVTLKIRGAKVSIDREADDFDPFLDTLLMGDFALAASEQPQLKAGELLTPARVWR